MAQWRRIERTGTVYILGAGPGDPDLLTVKGREVLSQADLVVYDHLVSPKLLTICPPKARLVYAGKEARRHTKRQPAINRLLVSGARGGRTVVRLKGGDPFLFGRGGEEAMALAAARVPFEVIPGVTSATAVPAYAGIPLTHRALASSVGITTGHEGPRKGAGRLRWRALAQGCETLVFLMGVGALGRIADRLVRQGRARHEPCAVIEWGTLPVQRTILGTLKTIAAQAAAAGIHPPAVFIVGRVVALRRRLAWFEAKPLFGRRVLVTRMAEQSASLSRRLAALGAVVEELPAIRLAPTRRTTAFAAAIRQLPRTDWVFFTSPEGIEWFLTMLKPHRQDLRCLAGCRIGAIGPKTAAAIEAKGLTVDLLPRRYSQEGLLEALPTGRLRGRRALIFSAEASREHLEAGLRERGMRVTNVALYRTLMPRGFAGDLARVLAHPVDAITVTSSSCVRHVAAALRAVGRGALMASAPFVSIGPVTSAEVRAWGGRVAVEASPSTAEGLVDAVVQACRRVP